jgi:translation initiation factor IF-2
MARTYPAPAGGTRPVADPPRPAPPGGPPRPGGGVRPRPGRPGPRERPSGPGRVEIVRVGSRTRRVGRRPRPGRPFHAWIRTPGGERGRPGARGPRGWPHPFRTDPHRPAHRARHPCSRRTPGRASRGGHHRFGRPRAWAPWPVGPSWRRRWWRRRSGPGPGWEGSDDPVAEAAVVAGVPAAVPGEPVAGAGVDPGRDPAGPGAAVAAEAGGGQRHRGAGRWPGSTNWGRAGGGGRGGGDRAGRVAARVAGADGPPGDRRLLEARLDHPLPHLVFEYVEGPTLDDAAADEGRSTRSTCCRSACSWPPPWATCTATAWPTWTSSPATWCCATAGRC